MSRRFLCVAALALALPAAAFAQSSSRPFTLGISAGLSQPIGDFGNDVKTGYNINGMLGLKSATMPVGVRLEVNYNRFDIKNTGGVSANVSTFGGGGNLVYMFPMQGSASTVRPYIMGGVGVYNVKGSASSGGVTASRSATKFGLNGGAGLEFALSGFNTFLEARFQSVFTDNRKTNYIPISFGIKF